MPMRFYSSLFSKYYSFLCHHIWVINLLEECALSSVADYKNESNRFLATADAFNSFGYTSYDIGQWFHVFYE